MIFGNDRYIVGFDLKLGLFIYNLVLSFLVMFISVCLWVCLYMQTMMCALAPHVNSSVPIISAVWCAPVTLGIVMTGNDTETARNHTAWVRLLLFMLRYWEQCTSLMILNTCAIYFSVIQGLALTETLQRNSVFTQQICSTGVNASIKNKIIWLW